MVRVREVPAATNRLAVAIGIVVMITHWQKPVFCASPEDVWRVHLTANIDPTDSVATPFECAIFACPVGISGHTHGVGMVLPASAPHVGATGVDQSTIVVSPACIEEDILDLPLVNLSIVPDVVRVRPVPIVSEALAVAISVVPVVTHWLHFLGFASSTNTGTVNGRLDHDAHK